MGGRGASSGISKKNNKEYLYGTEYTTIKQVDNIKFIKINEGSTTSPMETQTKGRIYVTVNKKTNRPQFITFYKDGKRYKTIEIKGEKHRIKGKDYRTHTHYGYEHRENGTKVVSKSELKLIAKVWKAWYN